MCITRQELKRLSQFHTEHGAISLYVYSPPGESSAAFNRRLNRLADTINREIKSFNGRWFVESHSLTDIKQTLVDLFMEHKGQTSCLFLSNNICTVVELPLPLLERVVVGTSFYLRPMTAMLEQFDRFAVLVFDRHQARLYTLFLGRLEFHESAYQTYVKPKFNVSTSSWECLREKTVCHRIEDGFHLHLQEVSEILLRNFDTLDTDKLLIGARRADVEAIRGHLHSTLLERLVDTFWVDFNVDIKIIEQKALQAAQDYRSHKERQKARDLIETAAHGKAVLGVSGVLDALAVGNVRQLVLVDDFHSEGYFCPERHYLTQVPTQDKTCIYCHKPLESATCLEEFLIEEVYAQGGELFHIMIQKQAMEEHDIGAFLRF